jgi:TET-associated glycosyltransferase-like protein
MYDAVVVPSYARADTCAQDTVATLLRGGVPAEKIQVWVGDGGKPEILAAYRAALPAGTQLFSAPFGLAPARNAISTAWPAGARLVHCDDDIRAIKCLSSDGKRLDDVTNLDHFFSAAFQYAAAQWCGLWGLSPVVNPFYMRNQWRAGLYFAIGQCFGVVNDPKLMLRHSAKEDYERTLLYYERDGAVVRINSHVAQTRPMRGHPGGMQAANPNRRADEAVAVTELKRRWPYLVRDKKSRDGYPEIALTAPKKGGSRAAATTH